MAEAFFRSQPSPEERREGYQSWIEVDLDCVVFNLEQIRRSVGVEVTPCVKADACGHRKAGVGWVAMFLGRWCSPGSEEPTGFNKFQTLRGPFYLDIQRSITNPGFLPVQECQSHRL